MLDLGRVWGEVILAAVLDNDFGNRLVWTDLPGPLSSAAWHQRSHNSAKAKLPRFCDSCEFEEFVSGIVPKDVVSKKAKKAAKSLIVQEAGEREIDMGMLIDAAMRR